MPRACWGGFAGAPWGALSGAPPEALQGPTGGSPRQNPRGGLEEKGTGDKETQRVLRQQEGGSLRSREDEKAVYQTLQEDRNRGAPEHPR